jgi:S1-C subfamily serine protease
VQITAESTAGATGSRPFGAGETTGEATGTGFVVDADGLIVTSEHVVDDASGSSASSIALRHARRWTASAFTVTLSNGDDRKATLVDKDASTDLAVLKVDPGSHDLQTLELSDDTGIEIGDTATPSAARSAERHADDRRDLRPAPPDHRAERLLDLQRDPDRRRAQPRQLRWPAAERGG